MTSDPEWLFAFRTWSRTPEAPQFPSRHEEVEAEEIFKAGWDAAKASKETAAQRDQYQLQRCMDQTIAHGLEHHTLYENADRKVWRCLVHRLVWVSPEPEGGQRPFNLTWKCGNSYLLFEWEDSTTTRNPWKENSHS